MIYNDTDIEEFICDVSVMNPVILETFNRLERMVEKTDYWRYLIVYYFGGVYADSDIEDFVPVVKWESWRNNNAAKMVVGVENKVDGNESRRRQRYTHYTQFMQWTFVKQNEEIERETEKASRSTPSPLPSPPSLQGRITLHSNPSQSHSTCRT